MKYRYNTFKIALASNTVKALLITVLEVNLNLFKLTSLNCEEQILNYIDYFFI